MTLAPLDAGAARSPLPATPAPIGGAPAGAAGRTVSTPALAAPKPAAASSPGGLIGQLLSGLDPTAAQRSSEALGGLLGRLVKATLGASPAATATKAATAGSGSLAFLKDAKLSVEEKLARLMVHLSDKYENQLEEKLRQYGDLESKGSTTSTASKSSSSSGSSSSSPFASLTSGLKNLFTKAGLGSSLLSGTFLPQLATQLAAPVLAGAATALGMPALAPAILKAGPLLGSVASGAVSALTGGAATGTKATTSSSTAASGSADAPSEKQLMTEIQILQEKQKEMFTLVSNILRSLHDTKMAVIGNLR